MKRPPYSPQPRLIRDIIAGLCGALITVSVVYIALVVMLSPAYGATVPTVKVYQSCKHETQALAWHSQRGETLQSAVIYGGGTLETWIAPSGAWTQVVLWANGERCWAAWGNPIGQENEG